ncbi:carbohydrate esterase family 8 protein [Artomyces pyxidatus]|uniref:Carbohydrate esterase family 8 protein n=1 Tax=Artomyces pyxidatus TaxID=48021 RepID=A0ACB8T9P0_9AGAM|nr:carbohydrate esterase family 8 protein [Artomyces pyxidatus]
MLQSLFLLSLFVASAIALNPPSSRTTPPLGALVVRAGTNSSDEFATFIAAVAALPGDSSAQSIFIYPGTYTGQVLIDRDGPVTIYGYTTNAALADANVVNITASVPASVAGSDDASGTLRIHSDNVAMYNVNIRNDFGVGSQAIAVSNNGNHVGLYACGLYGFQDTLYTNEGTHVYLQGHIEGAVDFIFGQRSQAYFEGNTIAVSGAGCITANGRSANDSGIYVLNRNKVILAPDAASKTSGKIFFGRPWRDYARVVFISTIVTASLNPAIWSEWSSTMPNTDHILFADWNTTGSGIPSNVAEPNFATQLSAAEAKAYNITTALGSGWQSWVDMDYLL